MYELAAVGFSQIDVPLVVEINLFGENVLELDCHLRPYFEAARADSRAKCCPNVVRCCAELTQHGTYDTFGNAAYGTPPARVNCPIAPRARTHKKDRKTVGRSNTG